MDHFRLIHCDSKRVVIQFVNHHHGRVCDIAIAACKEFGITIPPGLCYIEHLHFANGWNPLANTHRVYAQQSQDRDAC